MPVNMSAASLQEALRSAIAVERGLKGLGAIQAAKLTEVLD